MDPVTITCLALVSGYTIWNVSSTKNDKSSNMYMTPNEYHELCRKYSFCESPYDDILEKFRKNKKITESYVISELAFRQLLLFNQKHDKKDDIKNEKVMTNFYLTLNACLNEHNTHTIKNYMWINDDVKLKLNKNIAKLYNVSNIKNNEIKDVWKNQINSENEFENTGNVVLVNKLVIDETLTNAVMDNDVLIFYKNILSDEDNSLLKIEINNSYSLLIFSRKQSFDKNWISKKIQTLEEKRMLVIIPKIDINTIIELKKIVSIKNSIKEFDEDNTDVGTSNVKTDIISFVTFKLKTDNTKKIDKSEYEKIYEKNTFNYVLLHTPSSQIILAGAMLENS